MTKKDYRTHFAMLFAGLLILGTLVIPLSVTGAVSLSIPPPEDLTVHGTRGSFRLDRSQYVTAMYPGKESQTIVVQNPKVCSVDKVFRNEISEYRYVVYFQKGGSGAWERKDALGKSWTRTRQDTSGADAHLPLCPDVDSSIFIKGHAVLEGHHFSVTGPWRGLVRVDLEAKIRTGFWGRLQESVISRQYAKLVSGAAKMGVNGIPTSGTLFEEGKTLNVHVLADVGDWTLKVRDPAGEVKTLKTWTSDKEADVDLKIPWTVPVGAWKPTWSNKWRFELDNGVIKQSVEEIFTVDLLEKAPGVPKITLPKEAPSAGDQITIKLESVWNERTRAPVDRFEVHVFYGDKDHLPPTGDPAWVKYAERVPAQSISTGVYQGALTFLVPREGHLGFRAVAYDHEGRVSGTRITDADAVEMTTSKEAADAANRDSHTGMTTKKGAGVRDRPAEPYKSPLFALLAIAAVSGLIIVTVFILPLPRAHAGKIRAVVGSTVVAVASVVAYLGVA